MVAVDAMSIIIFARVLRSGVWNVRNEQGTEKVNKAGSLALDERMFTCQSHEDYGSEEIRTAGS